MCRPSAPVIPLLHPLSWSSVRHPLFSSHPAILSPLSSTLAPAGHSPNSSHVAGRSSLSRPRPSIPPSSKKPSMHTLECSPYDPFRRLSQDTGITNSQPNAIYRKPLTMRTNDDLHDRFPQRNPDRRPPPRLRSTDDSRMREDRRERQHRSWNARVHDPPKADRRSQMPSIVSGLRCVHPPSKFGSGFGLLNDLS
jgi:hypothetical protein